MRPIAGAASGVGDRLAVFVTEQFPFALSIVRDAFERAAGAGTFETADEIHAFRPTFRAALESVGRSLEPSDLETSPGISAHTRTEQAYRALVEACDGLLCREAIARS